MGNGKKQNYVDMRHFLNYEAVESNIVYRLVNTDKNRELLGDMPHMDYFDMSVIFCCLIEQGEFCSKSIRIHNVHMKLWGVSVEELYQAAEKNTKKLEGYMFKSISDVMCDIMRMENPDGVNRDSCISEFSDNIPMYVLSNRNWIEGASCMIYPNLLRNIANRIDSSFYIVPSSIHEVIIIPEENLDDRKVIEEMLKEGNDIQLESEEILSYSVFWYSREDEKISIL